MAASAQPIAIYEGTEDALRPPPNLSLSRWADEHFYLSAESAAEPGRWHTLPYQRGVMDAITDPAVRQVSWMKSARIGYTKCINALIGYHMDQDPCSILVVQPTVEDAEGYSKEEIAPMLRDCPKLAALVDGGHDLVGKPVGKPTILSKAFPGGVLSIVGANSGRGFRRVSRRVVIFDEVDGYPASAGSEGDQIKLGMKRAEYFWNRKIVAGSTPLVAGISRIEALFEQGDRRRYYVPCPQCGHMDFLAFRQHLSEEDGARRGHWMQWPEGKPREACFVCSANGCIIEHEHKPEMLERGEWRGEVEFDGHASFHLWAAYSLSPNATWGQLAEEFLEAKRGGMETLKTYVNTVLGETWRERGEAPNYERLYQRREQYQIGSVPAGVRFLTAGVDVQKDRFVYEVVGWSETKESWSVDAGVLPGDTSAEESWLALDGLLGRAYRSEEKHFVIAMMAVDSGYNTNQVYGWCRRHPMTRVIATKGMDSERALVGTPSAVDVTVRGKRLQRGYKVWPVGPGVAKGELYGWLRLPAAGPGYCHFPEYGEEYFKQLTAEHLVAAKDAKGFTRLQWQLIPNRENHQLDCRVLARVAACVLGLDRLPPPPPPNAPPPPPKPPRPESQPPAETSRESAQPRPARAGKWLDGKRRPGRWLGRRR